jgi:hypothetical protein
MGQEKKYETASSSDDDDDDVEVIEVGPPLHSNDPLEDSDKSYAVMPTSSASSAASSFAKSIKQPKKTSDDSEVSFGDDMVGTVGNFEFAPSAPPLWEEEEYAGVMQDQLKKEYEEWLRATQVSVRRSFKHHSVWEDHLKNAGFDKGFCPTIKISELPEDTISCAFREQVEACLLSDSADRKEEEGSSNKNNTSPAINSFLHGELPTAGFNKFDVYVPDIVRSKDPKIQLSKWADELWHAGFDEVQEMVAITDTTQKGKWIDPTHNKVPPNALWVISDHNGSSSGRKFELWGPGVKKRFFKPASGKALNKISGHPHSIELGTDYAHVQGRFTIVRIFDNEMGFLWNKERSQVERMLPGRYFIREWFFSYIGKAKVKIGSHVRIDCHSKESQIKPVADRLSIVHVPPGQIAFLRGPQGVFLLEGENQTYVIDSARNEEFLSLRNSKDRICTAEEKAVCARDQYTILQLQPGEFAQFIDRKSQVIIWHYNPENPLLNRIHLSGNYFTFINVLKRNNGNQITTDGTCIINNREQDFVVLLDPTGSVRFLEEANASPVMLRLPWKYLGTHSKSELHFIYGEGTGREVSRLRLAPVEWAVVQTQAGEVKLFPSLLTDTPYYFYQPAYTFYDVVNRSSTEVQTVELPGYKITVANLATGELGACRIKNVNMFLNPRPLNPYVFISPDEFLGKAEVSNAHFAAGDLHYIRVNADERMCVVRDGEAILLPPQESSDDTSLQKESKGNGVFIFRARQSFDVVGPFKRTEKSCTLGPWQFFTVPPGHVGYGIKNGSLCVWGEGQGCANISRNEQFSGFFQTNVDPVVTNDVEVMCKHAITSHLKLTVTYSILDPIKTITTFGGDHEKLHRFIESLSVSKILELCAKRPPMGFSEADFDPQTATLAAENARNLSKEEEEATDKSRVSGELLEKLRQHPEVLRAGVHIGFAEIQEWKIDATFMGTSKDIAMQLQQTHAETEKKRMLLEQQKLDNIRAVEAEKAQIEQQKLNSEKQQLLAEAKKQQAVILAEQEAATKMAHARAEAEAETAKRQAELKQQELAAETAKIIALRDQEKREIENATMVKAAEAKAMMQASQETAGRVAAAKANQEAASLELASAETLLQANKIKAQATLELMKGQAQGEQAIAEAKVIAQFPGLTPQERAQYLIMMHQMETQKSVAQNTKQVVHTMDPTEAMDIYNKQMQQMMTMNQLFVPSLNGNTSSAPLSLPIYPASPPAAPSVASTPPRRMSTSPQGQTDLANHQQIQLLQQQLQQLKAQHSA